MKKLLTQKEQKVWQGILGFYLNTLKKPTREELGRYLDMSPQLVQYYLKKLKRKKWVRIRPLKKGGIVLP